MPAPGRPRLTEDGRQGRPREWGAGADPESLLPRRVGHVHRQRDGVWTQPPAELERSPALLRGVYYQCPGPARACAQGAACVPLLTGHAETRSRVACPHPCVRDTAGTRGCFWCGVSPAVARRSKQAGGHSGHSLPRLLGPPHCAACVLRAGIWSEQAVVWHFVTKP